MAGVPTGDLWPPAMVTPYPPGVLAALAPLSPLPRDPSRYRPPGSAFVILLLRCTGWSVVDKSTDRMIADHAPDLRLFRLCQLFVVPWWVLCHSRAPPLTCGFVQLTYPLIMHSRRSGHISYVHVQLETATPQLHSTTAAAPEARPTEWGSRIRLRRRDRGSRHPPLPPVGSGTAVGLRQDGRQPGTPTGSQTDRVAPPSGVP